MTQLKLYFEDFEAGQVFELGSRTLSAERILEFAREFDPQPFHIDEAAAARSIYGRLIASGWHTGSTLMGLVAEGLLNRTTSQGSPGLEELRWTKPVYPGDELSGRCTVEQTRASRSKPDRGSVLILSELRNQHGDVCVAMRSWGIFLRRGPRATPD
ncbi:MAG: MaoC family dehydratase [Pseudomonadota bacterium]